MLSQNNPKIKSLRIALESLYIEYRHDLLFHGWHHIVFVTKKAIEFAKSIEADEFLVESASLVHDLNYIVKRNSIPNDGEEARQKLLIQSGYTISEIKRIEKIIIEADTFNRDNNISIEGKALSDADTLFKALPITPVIFSSKYIHENKIDIYELAEKITKGQNKLMDSGIYFYTDVAKEKYLEWGRVNLALWNSIKDALQDKDVQDLLKMVKEIGLI